MGFFYPILKRKFVQSFSTLTGNVTVEGTMAEFYKYRLPL